MVILAWLVLGLIVGFAARWIVPGEAPGGIPGDAITGAAGAIAGGWLYVKFAGAAATIDVPSLVCALIGAAVLLRLLRAIRGRRAV